MQLALEQEANFQHIRVVIPGATSRPDDFEARELLVLPDLGKHEAVLKQRLEGAIATLSNELKHAVPLENRKVEMRLVAFRSGDSFRAPAVAASGLAFVYFLHVPESGSGGELRVFDTRDAGDRSVPASSFRSVRPQPNHLMAFARDFVYQVSEIRTASMGLADSLIVVIGEIVP